MKRITRLSKNFYLLTLIILSGCQTSVFTTFAPFDARLEPVPNGAAKYLLFLNSSDQALHNFSFSAYMWNDDSRSQLRRSRPIKRYIGSGIQLLPGQSIRFHPIGFGIEDPVLENVSRVEIMGHSKEGDFRELWLNTPSGELQFIQPSHHN